MARNIIVLGASMIGVSVAWHLVHRGHDVTLVDRREPGLETAFGNAGIIQREAVRPMPSPGISAPCCGCCPTARWTSATVSPA